MELNAASTKSWVADSVMVRSMSQAESVVGIHLDVILNLALLLVATFPRESGGFGFAGTRTD